MGEALAPGIGEQAVEDAGEVLQMEARGGQLNRPFPKQGVRKSGHLCIDLFTGLQQGMGDRLK